MELLPKHQSIDDTSSCRNIDNMTPKELQHLTTLHGRLAAGTFSETDVSAFLMILRAHAGNGSLKELSHHMAHNERDRGKFFKRILANKEAIDNLGRKPGKIVSGDVFTVDDFGKELNRALKKVKLAPLPVAKIELIVICIMSLLQGGTFKKGKNFAELSLIATTADFQLCATVTCRHKGKDVRVQFVVLTVPNRWLPICNPRAHLDPDNLVIAKVEDDILHLQGFKPFEVYIERDPPFDLDDIDLALAKDPRISRTDSKTLRALAKDGSTLNIRWDGTRLTMDGRPEHFQSSSEIADVIRQLAERLGGCVHDDSAAHWFLPGLTVADDGFHSHWVGSGGPNCNRRQ